MTRTLPTLPAASRLRTLGVAAACVVVVGVIAAWAATAVTPATGQTRRGLTGAYYLPSSRGFVIDDDGLPVPTKEPDARRVDAEIAFGRGKGFVRQGPKGQLIWWVPERDSQVAVIWRGHVRLPKAGTYYFATVSDDASAVYLNRSRVALNGDLGGYIQSAAFRYPEAKPGPHPARPAYVIPVPVDGPRELPIEVRYVARNVSGGFGIDLYWVTPDAQRDAAGTPIAELVPAAALSTEPTQAVQSATVSAAHSTISSDFLYFPPGNATLTIRLADGQGRPVPGRRVHVSGVASFGPPDVITQPANVTDEHGIATATVQGASPKHVTTFVATDVTEFVDVGQTAEMTRAAREKVSFLPPAFAPYYDGKHFKVSPTPLRVGRATTISVPVTNRQRAPAQLRIRLLMNPPSIGLRDWTRIGETEPFVLQPGETRVAELTWTPATSSAHVCFKVEVWGASPRSARSGMRLLAVTLAQAADTPAKDGASSGQLLEHRQQNIGQVTCEPDAKKRCEALADARKTAGKIVATHMSSRPDSAGLESSREQLDGQLKAVRELLCDDSAAQRKVDEMRQRLESFDPGRAKSRKEVVSEGRAIAGIEIDLEQLSSRVCAVARPSPPKEKAEVKKDDPCLRDTKDLLRPKEGLEFVWWWIQEVFVPDPSPPGFDPLDPCLAPQAIDGWVETQQQLKARDALQNDRLDEYERIRKMSRQEFLKEYAQ